jgi:hypothetical protein
MNTQSLYSQANLSFGREATLSIALWLSNVEIYRRKAKQGENHAYFNRRCKTYRDRLPTG